MIAVIAMAAVTYIGPTDARIALEKMQAYYPRSTAHLVISSPVPPKHHPKRHTKKRRRH